MKPRSYENNPKGDAAWAAMKLESKRFRESQERARAEVLTALAVSPAVRGTFGPGKSYEGPRMVIVSGELSDHASGKLRATFFGPDGPHGHVTKPTVELLAAEIANSFDGPYVPMTEDDVIAWTSTDEFIKGTKVAAFVQADNTLRYRASRAGRFEWGQQVSRDANMMGIERIDEAIEMLHAAIRELPQQNPRRRGFVLNPPWVTKALADSYEVLDDKVPSRWLPQLAAVEARSSKGIIADLVEFGCGSYGCVLATNDATTVLKVTSDETEADFAARISPELAAPICVDYRMVVRLNRKHEGRTIHLLWREEAQHVGEIEVVLADNQYAVRDAIHLQHSAAQQAFQAFMDMGHGQGDKRRVDTYVGYWLERVKAMGERVPELTELADGLLTVWERQRILFGDIHAGNLGLVTRGDRQAWVITDPGNVAVVQS